MCTLTYLLKKRCNYEVFFNRDEQKSRPKSLPIKKYFVDGVNIISPIDSLGGGTWISLNENGNVFALLNGYEHEDKSYDSNNKLSRGKLLQSLSSSLSHDDIISKISLYDLNNFRPFYLVAFLRNKEAVKVHTWKKEKGDVFERVNLSFPISSSSFDYKNVIKNRKKIYNKLNLNDKKRSIDFLNYHMSIGEIPSAYSVRMNRTDAQTWSISHISVKDNKGEFRCESENLNLVGNRVMDFETLDLIS